MGLGQCLLRRGRLPLQLILSRQGMRRKLRGWMGRLQLNRLLLEVCPILTPLVCSAYANFG